MEKRELYRVYLKRRFRGGTTHFVISESFQDNGCWKHRDLVDLGINPGQYIDYPGGNSFHVKESLLEKLESIAETYDEETVEKLLMPFLDPRIREIVERFDRSDKTRQPWHNISDEALLEKQKALNSFDKRRIHYLRFGRVQIGDLDRRPWKFLAVLFDKSRDEIEAMIEEMELDLRPHERSVYVYTAFQLQSHFPHLLTRYHPSAIDPEKLDRLFLKDICRLNRQPGFFSGLPKHDLESLHPYLIKYLILYFDNDFVPGSMWGAYVRDFMWRHQFYRHPPSKSTASPSHKEACLCLEITPEEFQKMDRKKLTRCYRRLAKKTHPDSGGESGQFIEITAAYETLLKMK